MMPGMNGFEVCKMLKKLGNISVIMLTAKDEVDERVKGPKLGADDYMIKPFSFEELLARIHARIRNQFPRTLIPLSNMVNKVEQINSGNLNIRVPSHRGQLEIDRLALSFNGMLERLKISFEAEKEAKEQMRRFIADASHELRTPLTSIHGFLGILLRGAVTRPEQLEKVLKTMLGESERVNKLVQDLLLLAKLDSVPAFEMEEVDGLIHEMESQLRLLAGERNVIFSITPNVKTMIDRDKIKQVILN
jgi:two-component system OmpR family sensor kinase